MTRDEYSEQIAQMSKSMFRYCLSRTNSYHDAEDLAQEILLISCKGENSFPNEKAFYAFVSVSYTHLTLPTILLV